MLQDIIINKHTNKVDAAVDGGIEEEEVAVVVAVVTEVDVSFGLCVPVQDVNLVLEVPQFCVWFYDSSFIYSWFGSKPHKHALSQSNISC